MFSLTTIRFLEGRMQKMRNTFQEMEKACQLREADRPFFAGNMI